jgi:signal transduction histidine kinase
MENGLARPWVAPDLPRVRIGIGLHPMSNIPVSERDLGTGSSGKVSRWNFPSRRTRWLTAGGFFLATGLLVFLMGMAYRETNRQIRSSESVIHSRDVISALGDYASAARAGTIAATDFYKTGNAASIPVFESALTGIHSAIDHVRQLTVDNPTQQRLAANLLSQTDLAFHLIRQSMDDRLQGKSAADALADVTKQVRSVSLDLNKTYTGMVAEEDRLLKSRSDGQAAASRSAKRLELWGGIVAFLLMGGALAVFWRESSVRLRAERLLAQANVQLEHRVRERTMEVERINNLLRDENAERVAAEEEIRLLNAVLEQRVIERTAQLQASNHELEAFCYSVSHDLRAPLRHIDGFSKILMEDFASQLTPEAAHCLDRIQKSINNMGLLVDALLNLSRLTRKGIAPQRVPLGEMVNVARTELQTELAGRNVTWRIGALPVVQGDPSLLKQVFVNLLANAVKFTRNRESAVIEVFQLEGKDETTILIRDNGVGFNMKYADKLFGVFQRLHTSEQFEGTGVGLATVQRIIQKHGGRVWAESEPEHGASFYFTVGIPATTASGSWPAERIVS